MTMPSLFSALAVLSAALLLLLAPSASLAATATLIDRADVADANRANADADANGLTLESLRAEYTAEIAGLHLQLADLQTALQAQQALIDTLLSSTSSSSSSSSASSPSGPELSDPELSYANPNPNPTNRRSLSYAALSEFVGLSDAELDAELGASTFAGLEIKRDSARVALGGELDVQLVRRADGVLEIVGGAVVVHGSLDARALSVGGTNLTDYIRQASRHSVAVEVLTSNATSSNSVDTIFLEFYLPNFGYWTEKMVFFEGTDQGERHYNSYVLPDIPSQVRLSSSGDDAWGFLQLAVWIDQAGEMVIVCPGVLGDHPSMGDNGHWIDGDGSGGAPTTVTHNVAPACVMQATVTVETGSATYSDTTNTVYVAFNVDGEWTAALPLFTGTSIGDYEQETYGLPGTPSQIAFTISSTNAWGFDYLEIEVDGYTFVLSCQGDQTGMSSSSEHWVDGDGSSGVTDELILDIEHTDCDSSS